MFDRGGSVGKILGIFGLVFATSAWGGLFFVGKSALRHLDPYWFTVVRYSMSSLVFLVFLSIFGERVWDKILSDMPRLFFLGMCGYAVFGMMVFVGLSMSVSAHGAVVMATIPLTATLIGWLIDGLRPNVWALVACFLALLGVLMVSGVLSQDSRLVGAGVWKGDLIAYIGSIGWVIYTRGQREMTYLSVIEYTGLTTLVSLPGVVAVAALASYFGVAQFPSVSVLSETLPEMLYVVCVATVLAVVFYNYGVRKLGTIGGVAFINLVPVSALLIGFLKGENLAVVEVLGAALVVMALSLLVYSMRKPAFS